MHQILPNTFNIFMNMHYFYPYFYHNFSSSSGSRALTQTGCQQPWLQAKDVIVKIIIKKDSLLQLTLLAITSAPPWPVFPHIQRHPSFHHQGRWMNTELAGTAAPEDTGTSRQVSPCRKPNGATPALHKPLQQHITLP